MISVAKNPKRLLVFRVPFGGRVNFGARGVPVQRGIFNLVVKLVVSQAWKRSQQMLTAIHEKKLSGDGVVLQQREYGGGDIRGRALLLQRHGTRRVA